ncbi:MAG: hypothetical protein HY558_02620 [Euryarchaeota archaeon]|nr:hypothetical protein [Euryarchaeota archaeon]
MPTPSKKPSKKKKAAKSEKAKSKKLPPWFDLGELREKGVEGVAKAHGLKAKTVLRTLNKAGYSKEDIEKPAAAKETPGAPVEGEAGIVPTLQVSRDILKEFQVAKKDFEARAAKAIDDASFTRVLLALYKMVSRESST